VIVEIRRKIGEADAVVVVARRRQQRKWAGKLDRDARPRAQELVWRRGEGEDAVEGQRGDLPPSYPLPQRGKRLSKAHLSSSMARSCRWGSPSSHKRQSIKSPGWSGRRCVGRPATYGFRQYTVARSIPNGARHLCDGFAGGNALNCLPPLVRGKLLRSPEAHASHLGALAALCGAGAGQRALELGEADALAHTVGKGLPGLTAAMPASSSGR
jgi:hypothetical protein